MVDSNVTRPKMRAAGIQPPSGKPRPKGSPPLKKGRKTKWQVEIKKPAKGARGGWEFKIRIVVRAIHLGMRIVVHTSISKIRIVVRVIVLKIRILVRTSMSKICIVVRVIVLNIRTLVRVLVLKVRIFAAGSAVPGSITHDLIQKNRVPRRELCIQRWYHAWFDQKKSRPVWRTVHLPLVIFTVRIKKSNSLMTNCTFPYSNLHNAIQKIHKLHHELCISRW